MFKRKRYKMKFKKNHIYSGYMEVETVTDAYLLSNLFELQREYDFEVISVRLLDSLIDKCCIKIKCAKEDKYKIFSEYCSRMEKYITEVNF